MYDYVAGSPFKSIEEAVEFWSGLVKSYPCICAIIDPFRKQVCISFLYQKLILLIKSSIILLFMIKKIFGTINGCLKRNV